MPAMISVKPTIEYEGRCPRCDAELIADRILWQGIHVCAVCRCNNCGAEIVGDLGIGQAFYTPYRVDMEKGLLFGEERAQAWFGNPLLIALQKPDRDREIVLDIEKFHTVSDAVILNCIDYLYGHSLLKLLNAAAHLRQSPGPGLVVIVPSFLRWMVPEGVAEIWTVNIPLNSAHQYFPRLDELIAKECERFERVWLSLAHSHPAAFDISRFTGVERHDFAREDFRITFVWREDRPWLKSRLAIKLARLSGLMGLLLSWQNRKICRLFSCLRPSFPDAHFTVAGMGRMTSFPAWIDDERVERFTDQTERVLCRVYAESRLVVGVHGSNMLLPSGHAGMTLNLMPSDRWGNLAQDVLYHETDSRMASYRYRYIPLCTPVADVACIADAQVACLESFRSQMGTGQCNDC